MTAMVLIGLAALFVAALVPLNRWYARYRKEASAEALADQKAENSLW